MRLVGGIVVAGLLLAGCAATPSNEPSGCGGSIPGASAACATQGSTGAPGGLSRDAAIAAARRLAPSAATEPTLIWASIGDYPFSPASPVNRPVWMVRLEGPFAASPCPAGFLERYPSPSDGVCLDSSSGLVVVIDYFTGAFLGWLH
jgi:hypothetical protein